MKAYKITIKAGTYSGASLMNGNRFMPVLAALAGEGKVMKEMGAGKMITFRSDVEIITKSEDERDLLCSDYTTKGTFEEIEVEAPLANKATDRQINYLLDLGYTGTGNITKAQASTLIDQYKGSYSSAGSGCGLTAADVDDFTGPEWTW